MKDFRVSFQSVDNLLLILNGLQHIEFELNHSVPCYLRVAREAHQVLYRSLVESVKGTANLAVTGKVKDCRAYKYQIGDEPLKEIHKQTIKGCNRAWRFSDPIVIESSEEAESNRPQQDQSQAQRFLVHFYDALAMVQTECFMLHFVHSSKVEISDADMRILEWLHENVRNEFEHFVPRILSSSIVDLIHASKVSVSKAVACLLESNNILFYGASVDKALMQNHLCEVVALLDSHLQKATDGSKTLKT